MHAGPNTLQQAAVLTIFFLQDFKASYDACNIHDRPGLWLFKHYLAVLVEVVIKGRVALPTETSKSKEGSLASLSATVSYLLKRFATYVKVVIVEEDTRSFQARSLMATDFAQQLWKKKLRYGSVYTEKTLMGLFVEGVYRSICRKPRQWSSKHRFASLETLHGKWSRLPTFEKNPKADSRRPSVTKTNE